MNLTQLIKSKALDLGFDKIGISSPKNPLQHTDYYDDWIASEKNGTMRWLGNRVDERKDITKYHPEIKSIISVAINYYTGSSDEIVDKNDSGYKFSNYAWGYDYHAIIKNKLKELLEYIKKDLKVNTKGLVCVDTSPVMEKQWAKQADIGWQGKNTLLLTEEFGSWIFLGELLLDYEFEFDEPFVKDLCGTCTACIDACPTNALTEYQLDATKCISYLTAEFKEEFDQLQKNNLDGWIYGCDKCQQVCPWNNRSQTMSNEKLFQPIEEIQNYSIDDWLRINENKFRSIFKNSPAKRIKHHRFVRNVKAVKESSNSVE